ncbi:MAG: heparan-alpha-glucosaminide N-acetyltransferase domain-containing protein [Chitinophagaceae bacterium]|nr:heparan-alpha-glucosaminide N-acetyltransferase domain-containing protein [Chitinophagaceae bacterium]
MIAARSRSLDVFRGITVCFMIIVNMPGNYSTTYAPLLHAHWHGFTPTDLVFPSFLFAVGNAMSFVMVKWRQMLPQKVLWKILKRTFIIFLLGYLMYWFPFFYHNAKMELIFSPFSHTRVFGVLQRIALCFMLAALLLYYLKPKTTYIIAIIILLLYWLVMMLFGDGTDPLSMQGNAGFKLDMWLLGADHLYHGEGVAFDPEGLLSAFPATVNVIAGFWVGEHIRTKGQSYEMLSKLLLFAIGCVAIGYVWDWFFPINKKLWTSSYVFYSVGLSSSVLAMVIFIIDYLKKDRWAYFFEVFGKNPLFIYLLSEVVAILLWFIPAAMPNGKHEALYQRIYDVVFQPAGVYFGSFLFAIIYMLLTWAAGWLLDKRKIYYKSLNKTKQVSEQRTYSFQLIRLLL